MTLALLLIKTLTTQLILVVRLLTEKLLFSELLLITVKMTRILLISAVGAGTVVDRTGTGIDVLTVGVSGVGTGVEIMIAGVSKVGKKMFTMDVPEILLMAIHMIFTVPQKCKMLKARGWMRRVVGPVLDLDTTIQSIASLLLLTVAVLKTSSLG